MALVLSERLEVQTHQGVCSIDLCTGSVTKAETSTPVDVLVVSAYPGDYTPTHTSVIGALKRDLKVNVGALAASKKKDYRKLFSCWWSKKLSKGLPFKRILCFEGSFKRNARPPSTIGEVFRSLVSLCKGKDVSVMMPLLSTGDQHYSKDMMLRLIVETAIHWMKIGLPLRLLKIVIHQHDPSKLTCENQSLVDYFRGLKDEWQQIETFKDLQDTHFLYDYYIANAIKDQEVAEKIKKCLEVQYENCKIYHEHQEIDTEKSWQDQIYDVMVTCSRVLVILSPDFLEDTSCIEKYNLAMCCSRNMGRNFLAPIYVAELKEMPTYMGLIQYIDIRPVTDDSIDGACKTIPTLKESVSFSSDFDKAVKEKPSFSLDSSFDVFLSYSHKNEDVATRVYDHIKKEKPHWNIFLDQDSLKAGHSWQSKLYSSIESSKMVLALLSKPYLESKVCQEEYNLARCLSDDPSYSTSLVEVKIEEIAEFPKWCTPYLLVKMPSANEKSLTKIIDFLDQDRGQEWYYNSKNPQRPVFNINTITSMWRKEFARDRYPVAPNKQFTDTKLLKSFTERMANADEITDKDVYDVLVICHHHQHSNADQLRNQILDHLPKLRTAIVSNNAEGESYGHGIFDKSRILVPLLSKEYVENPLLMEYFNTALCRHRWFDEVVLCPIIVGKLPKTPLYPKIAFCLFSTQDSFWKTESSDCISTAAIVISNLIVQTPKSTNAFKTILSVRELEEWVVCKERGEKRESLSPLLFGNAKSGHLIMFDEDSCKNDCVSPLLENVKLDTNSELLDTNIDLLSAKGGHASQIVPRKNDENVSINDIKTNVLNPQSNQIKRSVPVENDEEENMPAKDTQNNSLNAEAQAIPGRIDEGMRLIDSQNSRAEPPAATEEKSMLAKSSPNKTQQEKKKDDAKKIVSKSSACCIN